jgi:hypothetical protein
MNRSGAAGPDGPMTRDALAKAIDEEAANLHRLETERTEAEARLARLRNELAELEAPAERKPETSKSHGPRTSTDKVQLFRRLFRGRPDIYPTRFVSTKTGKPGYVPAWCLTQAITSKGASSTSLRTGVGRTDSNVSSEQKSEAHSPSCSRWLRRSVRGKPFGRRFGATGVFSERPARPRHLRSREATRRDGKVQFRERTPHLAGLRSYAPGRCGMKRTLQ